VRNRVSYALASRDWHGDFVRLVQREIEIRGARRVCDIGGGANPALSTEFVTAHDLEYLVIDISAEELAKAPAGYRKHQADLASPTFRPPERFDLVFSATVCEHIPDPATFHRNVRSLLETGGLALHCFPTLYSLPFLLNRLLPEGVSQELLYRLSPGRRYDEAHGKFPALYRWCRGPTRRQIARFESVGFEVIDYVGLFGHHYFRPIRVIDTLESTVASWLVSHPLPWLTSYARVSLEAR
jgi:2-polyprenyl-3-methyl-5-hydroxy-6-metoxy-1,4-benzoquinol methylase